MIVTLIDGEQVFTKERIDNDLTGLIIAIVILSRANNESKTKRERSLEFQKILREKARQHGTPMTARCPTWLSLVGEGDTRRFVVNKSRAKTVQRIYKLSASGLGQNQIAVALNRLKIPTFTGKPKWQGGMVQHILQTDAVIGRFKLRRHVTTNAVRPLKSDLGGPIENYFPAIISPQLYERAKSAARARRTRPQYVWRRAYTNLASGLGHCAVCGGSVIYIDSGRGHVYLRCANKVIKECSNNGGFPVAKLEAILLMADHLTVSTASSSMTEPREPVRNENLAGLEAAVARKRHSPG